MYQNSSELTKRIADLLFTGCGEKEQKEYVLYQEVSQLPGNSLIRQVLGEFCDRMEEKQDA